MGARGEALRADVMAVLQGQDAPMSAYDILGALRDTQPKIAPTTVYRTLNALREQSLIRRLESLNAYVLSKNKTEDPSILSICDDCGSVDETPAPDVLATMAQAVGKTGFAPTRHVVEVHGTCADCGGEDETS